MKNSAVCCDSCFGLIAKKSTSAARLWLDLCDIQIESELFGLRVQDFPDLRLLEILGFIMTTENSEMIIVKVFGIKNTTEGFCFCGGKCIEQFKN